MNSIGWESYQAFMARRQFAFDHREPFTLSLLKPGQPFDKLSVNGVFERASL